jgi:hypothetical protein
MAKEMNIKIIANTRKVNGRQNKCGQLRNQTATKLSKGREKKVKSLLKKKRRSTDGERQEGEILAKGKKVNWWQKKGRKNGGKKRKVNWRQKKKARHAFCETQLLTEGHKKVCHLELKNKYTQVQLMANVKSSSGTRNRNKIIMSRKDTLC